MFRRFAVSVAAALLALGPSAALAASDADLAEIRRQIQELKSQYEARIQALEQRLREAEQRPAPAPAQPVVAAAPRPSASAFNPAISAILQGTYAHRKADPARVPLAGFPSGGEVEAPGRGFSLAESELILSANVDPYFAGNLTLALTPEDSVAVEEAYGTYLGAPFGTSLKFGRFLSGIGYLNEHHPHAWDFVDAPLAYAAFLGGRHAHDGVQARWVAPIERFLEAGLEVGKGEGFPGTPRDRNGAGAASAFLRTGGDIGASQSWRAGLSYLRTRAEDRESRQTDSYGRDVPLAFTGRSEVAIADFVWKYAPHGDARRGGVKVQGEYFRRRERGEAVLDFSEFGGARAETAHHARQSGWYLQGVYQFHPEWRAGARVDRLDPGRIGYGEFGAGIDAHWKPRRASFMVDYNPSEFSRVRLQYSRSHTLPEHRDDQWLVQYILSLGAHGAHKY